MLVGRGVDQKMVVVVVVAVVVMGTCKDMVHDRTVYVHRNSRSWV